jgi:hypothetical protein
MLDVLSYLPNKRKSTPSGWISFNAPCCGEKRTRGGIKISDQGWSYHCFNCGTTASFILGRTLGFKARRLLSKLGVPENEIEHLNLESLKHRNIHGILDERAQLMNTLSDISFEEFDDFPPFSEPVTPDVVDQWNYLRDRRAPLDYPFLTALKNDGIHWTRPHITIPFTYQDQIVGWTARFLDGKSPRYLSHSQPNYVFGTDLQHNNWQYAIVVEGIFDALSIAGLAVMHNNISDGQAKPIRNLGRDIIVVPDQDTAGVELIERAIELGWSVSVPDWGSDIKDVNDAVVKYGKLATLLTILRARETSRIKIELRKKNLVKRLRG